MDRWPTEEDTHLIAPRTLFTNGTIVTMNPASPRVKALAAGSGRILAAGSHEEAAGAAGTGARVVDLDGATVVPGFNDCHMHILSFGLQLDQVDVTAAAVHSVDSLVAALRSRVPTVKEGGWIRGRGYNHDLLTERRHPSRHDLDVAGVDHPIVVIHTSGHVLTCNTTALRCAGIDGNTADPPGGEIERNVGGEPTGVLKETAMQLVLSIVPPPTEEQAQAAILRAMRRLASEGITSASDAATGHDLSLAAELSAYKLALGSGDLAGRIVLMPEIHFVAPVGEDGAISAANLDVESSDWLRIGATKIFTDGAITTRTAWLTSPFAGSGGAGLPTWKETDLRGMVTRAHASGWQIATHAMGDRAIEAILAAYELAQASSPRAARHRIEHCSLPSREMCGRMAALGVVPVMQPELLARFGDSYVDGLGRDRAANAMPAAWLRELGIPIAFSSDRPVVPGSPLFGIQSAMLRTPPSGRVLGPDHRVTAQQALAAYTTGAAYATFTEQDKGRLMPGYLADFTVLNGDVTTVAPEEITSTKVLMTVVGGAVTYQAGE